MNCTNVLEVVTRTVREVAHLAEDDTDLTSDSDLLDEGFVDSLNLVTIVLRLEVELGVKFSDADMANNRFTTISGLTDIVCDKLQV